MMLGLSKVRLVRLVLCVALVSWLVIVLSQGGALWGAFGLLVAVIATWGVVRARTKHSHDGDPFRLSDMSVGAQAVLVAALIASTAIVDLVEAGPSPTGQSPWFVTLPIVIFLFADVWVQPVRRFLR